MKALLMVCMVFISGMVQAKALDMYVNTRGLNVRLAPNPSAKITNVIGKGQKVEVFEIRFGWARISRFYNGTAQNVNGEIARWVSYQYLSMTQPNFKKVVSFSSRLKAALSSSDDYRRYRSIFVDKANELMKLGRCKMEDFEETGGWVRSVKYKPQKVYFTYCESLDHVSGRIYLDVSSKTLFQ